MPIENYEKTQNLLLQGDSSSIEFGIKAFKLSLKDAKMANEAFDQFLGVIMGIEKPMKKMVVHSWSDAEKKVVRPCRNQREAWEKYHKEFPTSKRTRKIVQRWWVTYHDTTLPIETSDIKLFENAPLSGVVPSRCSPCTPTQPECGTCPVVGLEPQTGSTLPVPSPIILLDKVRLVGPLPNVPSRWNNRDLEVTFLQGGKYRCRLLGSDEPQKTFVREEIVKVV